MPVSQIKHIFFDLDRTLWDFEANSKKALQEIFHEYGLHRHIQHFNHFHQSYLRINSDLWRKYGKKKISKEELRDSRFSKTLAHHGIENPDLSAKISQAYIDLSPKQTLLFPKTLETLNELKNRGFVLHIITNGFQEVQYIKLKESGLQPFFDIIVCSEHIGFNKPDKRIFLHALELAGARAEESLMVGDDMEIDVLGANQVGMEAILFDPEKRHRSKSFQVINCLDELNELI